MREQEHFNKLRSLVQGIKIDGWTYKAPIHEGQLGDLVNDSIRGKIAFNTIWNDAGKLHIFSILPRDNQGTYYGGGSTKSTSINVSIGKTAEQIARDIERRLLSVYLPVLKAVCEQIDGTENYLRNKSAMGQAIKTACPDLFLRDGIKDRANGNRGNDVVLYSTPGHGVSIDIDCDPTSARVKIGKLTLAETIWLVQFVQDFRKGEPTTEE